MLLNRISRPTTQVLWQHSNLFSARLLNSTLQRTSRLNNHVFYSTHSTQPNTNNNSTKSANPNSNNANTKTNTNTKKQSFKSSKWWSLLKNISSFTASSALVVASLGLTTIVFYLIGKELFSPNGDTQLFNRSVTLVQDNAEVRGLLNCQDSLIKKEKLKAYGELVTHDKWTRNRPIVSKRRVDKQGNVHCFIRFHLQSKAKIGLVHVETIEIPGKFKPKFNCVYIDVPGQRRFFVVKPKLNSTGGNGNSKSVSTNNFLTKPFDLSWWKK